MVLDDPGAGDVEFIDLDDWGMVKADSRSEAPVSGTTEIEPMRN